MSLRFLALCFGESRHYSAHYEAAFDSGREGFAMTFTDAHERYENVLPGAGHPRKEQNI